MILSEKGVQGALFLMGEVLFIIRPLIYVLFIRKYGIRSWIPWFVSLAVDAGGVGFLTQVTKSRDGGKEQHYHLSASEQDEVGVLDFYCSNCICFQLIYFQDGSDNPPHPLFVLFVNAILIN